MKSLAKCPPGPIRLSRRRLHTLVWSEPVAALASRFGLSDVALAKACHRLAVPIPPRGHWAKVKAGLAPPVHPLRRPPTGTPSSITLTLVPEGQRVPPPTAAARKERRRKFAAATEGAQGGRLHPAVAAARSALRERAAREGDGVRLEAGEGRFDVRVGADSIRRATTLLDMLVKALLARGHSVADTPGGPRLTVCGEVIPFRFEERFDGKPTGKLAVKADVRVLGARRSWSDGAARALEDMLGEMVLGFEALGEGLARRRAEQAETLRRREEEDLVAAAAEAARAQEEARLSELEREAAAWRRASDLRAYADAVEAASAIRGPLDRDIGEWLGWVRAKADAIDPTERRLAHGRPGRNR